LCPDADGQEVWSRNRRVAVTLRRAPAVRRQAIAGWLSAAHFVLLAAQRMRVTVSERKRFSQRPPRCGAEVTETSPSFLGALIEGFSASLLLLNMSNIKDILKEITMSYLITGATGDIGARVVELLLRRGERPRILVRDAPKARARFGDRVDIRVGDLGSAESLRAALEGVDEFFLVNIGPQIPARDEIAAAAARAAGVKHLVKLSSMDVQHGLAIGAWHERGEAAVRASGVPFTFVQPTGFMSNLLAWAPSIKAERVVRASTGDGRRAFVHSDDIAAVAVTVLTTRAYHGESLPITGPEALSFAEVTARIGAALG